MKKIAFILALVMIFSSALWGCDTAETDTTGQAAESSGDIEDTNMPEKTDTDANTALNQSVSSPDSTDDSNKEIDDKTNSITGLDDSPEWKRQETIARTKNYHYYKIVGTFEIGCEIYNAAGEIVFTERLQRPMTVSEVDADLIEIRIGYGTGISGCRYFSIEKNQMSEEFFYVVATSGTQIAYLSGSIDDRKLIVQDIYQHTEKCQSFELDFSPEYTPVVDARFADNGARLQITYMKGQSRETTKATIELT